MTQYTTKQFLLLTDKSLISGTKWLGLLSPLGAVPCTNLTVRGSRLLRRFLAVCTPLMLSSRARAENLPRCSMPKRIVSPLLSRHFR